MRAEAASFLQRPRWVAALVFATTVTVWSIPFCSIAGQIGRPFPGFFDNLYVLLFLISRHLCLIYRRIAFGIFAHQRPID